MIRKRAKVTSIAVAEARFARAVEALRDACLTGVFTGKTDEHVRGWIGMLNRMREDIRKEKEKRYGPE